MNFEFQNHKSKIAASPSKRVNPKWLDPTLIGLGLICFVLFLIADFLKQFGGGIWLAIALGLLAIGVTARLYVTYQPKRTAITGLVVRYWPLLLLATALLVGGGSRYQALNNRVADNPATFAITTEALNTLRQNNWQPRSFEQPPLYLFFSAGVGELVFLQQATARQLNSLDELSPARLVEPLRWANLLLGLVSIGLVYNLASRLFGRNEAMVAALLLATSWLAYQATPALLPFTLGATLALGSFYFIVRGQSGWDFWWAGLLAGLASATVYGAVLLLIPLTLTVFRSKGVTRRFLVWGLGGAGWFLGWTLAASGSILSFNRFMAGLSAIGKAGPDAGGFYLKEALRQDVGLVIAFGVAVALAFGVRGPKALNLWLILLFPILYFGIITLVGPNQLERLALVAPFMAIVAAYPVGLAADWIQRTLDAHDDRHKWAGAALSLGLAVFITLLSVLARRLFP